MLSKDIVKWTKEWFEENKRKTAVIGVSGGKDSAVVAAISKEALGADKVLGIMMPNGEQKDLSDSETVVSELGINSGKANIKPVYDALLNCVEEAIGIPASEGARINVAPRIRMMLLYAIAQTISETYQAKACVMGTGNRGEAEVGYTTKWGDSASDINPIRNLWVSQVLQVGDELGYFPGIVHKTPSDGLCGKSDEERLGFTYDDVEALYSSKKVPKDIQDKINAAHLVSVHKRAAIPAYLPPEPRRKTREFI